MSISIEMKGLRDGLLATLPNDLPWEEGLKLFCEHLDRQPQFFKGAHLAVDLGTRSLRVNELVRLRDVLSERGISLWAVLSESPVTTKNAQLLGLATRLSKPSRSLPAGSLAAEMALWITRTVRSGVKIEHSGPVVVIGDVNPGAEIVTASSLVVWGRLRGRALIGHPQNLHAFLCVLRFQTTQATLAGISLPPSIPAESPIKIFLENNLPTWEKWE